MVSEDRIIKVISDIEAMKADLVNLKGELIYKHEQTIRDIEILHKRVNKSHDDLTNRIDLLRSTLDKKYLNGTSNGIRNNVNGWSDKKRATVGGGIGIGVIIAIIELFSIYKGG